MKHILYMVNVYTHTRTVQRIHWNNCIQMYTLNKLYTNEHYSRTYCYTQNWQKCFISLALTQNFRTWMFPCHGALRNGPSAAGWTTCKKLFFFCWRSRIWSQPINFRSSSPTVARTFVLKTSGICSPSIKFSLPGWNGFCSTRVFLTCNMLLVLISIPDPGAPPTW